MYREVTVRVIFQFDPDKNTIYEVQQAFLEKLPVNLREGASLYFAEITKGLVDKDDVIVKVKKSRDTGA